MLLFLCKFIFLFFFDVHLRFFFLSSISNGNRTEWSPIRSVIVRVINKIGRPRSGSPICMITDGIGRHEVSLPINHKSYNFPEKKNSQVTKERENLH